MAVAVPEVVAHLRDGVGQSWFIAHSSAWSSDEAQKEGEGLPVQHPHVGVHVEAVAHQYGVAVRVVRRYGNLAAPLLEPLRPVDVLRLKQLALVVQLYR